MKSLLSVLMTLISLASFADGLPTVEVNGNSYSNVSRAYLSAGGKVIIIFPGGGASADADKLPDDFLKSWGISVEGAKAAVIATAESNLEKAIQAGCFREVDGVVYDTRKSESGLG